MSNNELEDREQRTTALGLARYSREFYDAAIAADHALGRRPGYEIHAPPPVEYMVAHSIELALKSYLRFTEMPLRQVERHGHDLIKLWGSALERGIDDSVDLDVDELWLLSLVSYRHKKTFSRYIVTGPHTFPVFGPLQNLCERLVDSVCALVGYRP